MAFQKNIINNPAWEESPPGRYLLEWEQETVDRLVADVFGFHALQIGWPALQGLRANRMPHRWLMGDGTETRKIDASARDQAPPPQRVLRKDLNHDTLRVSVQADFDALPFPSNSLDLVLLPHTLELSVDPHQTLREVERVLMPEGRVIVLGLNPFSLWGLSHRLAAGAVPQGEDTAPPMRATPAIDGELIGSRRLRDWLRLLGFEVERSQFGCFRPAVRSQKWLDRYEWMEGTGTIWWPVLGAAYATVAVKRAPGLRLIGPVRKRAIQARRARAPAVATRGGSLRDGTPAIAPDES